MCFPIRVAVQARCLQDAAEPGAPLCPGAAGGTGITAAPTPNLARAGFQGQEGQVSAPSPPGESQPSSFSSLPLEEWEQLRLNLILMVV